MYAEAAGGWSPLDHAVGMKVDENLNATLSCSGCVKGAKKISIVNLADRMEDVCICNEYDLVGKKSLFSGSYPFDRSTVEDLRKAW